MVLRTLHLTRSQFDDLPWCDQRMYVEELVKEFSPEANADLEHVDEDEKVPDISELFGVKEEFVTFGEG